MLTVNVSNDMDGHVQIEQSRLRVEDWRDNFAQVHQLPLLHLAEGALHLQWQRTLFIDAQ